MDYLSRIQRIIGTGLMLAITSTGLAQDSKETVLQYIDDNASLYGEVAQQIWDWAEVGYLETKSSNLLQQQLAAAKRANQNATQTNQIVETNTKKKRRRKKKKRPNKK